MVTRDAAYRRLLTWYPKPWREAHGEALLGVMLDAAEAEGRDRPTAAERQSAAAHGLGARLDERFALVSAAASTVIAALAVFAFVTGAQGLMLPSFAIVPWLSALALIALFRAKAALPDLVAVTATTLTTLTFALGFATMLSWSLAFDAADEGLPGTWFSQTMLLWLGATWLIGTVTIALIAFGLLKTVRLPFLARVGVSVISGVIATPLIAAVVMGPLVTALISVGALLLVVSLGMPRQRTTAHASTHAQLSDPAPEALKFPSRVRRRTARAIAALALVLSALGLAYALTGSTWAAGGPNSTTTMRIGITAMAIAGAILIIAVALIAVARVPGPRRGIPLAMIALALVLAAAGNVLGMGAGPMHPATLIAMALLAAGLATLIGLSRRGIATQRWIIGVAVGLIVAPLAALLLPGLVFVVPVLATGFAVWRTRAPRTVALSAAPVPA